MVEEIEGLAENLSTVTVAEANFLGEAQVHVDGALHLEGIATNDVDALAAIGTVHPPTERRGGHWAGAAPDGGRGGAESKTFRRAGRGPRMRHTVLSSAHASRLTGSREIGMAELGA